MADNSNYLSTPSEYATPSQIKSTQDYAKALLYGSGQQPVHHWAQGLSNMVSALVGGNLDYRAGQRERASQLSDAEAKSSGLRGTGAFPDNGPPSPQASVPFTGSPAEAGSTNTPEAGDTLAKMAAVTSGQESGGNYHSIGPETRTGDRAYGKYQVMGANVPSWTQEATGRSMTPAEFLQDSDAQEAVYKTKMGQYAQKYGPEGASRAWFAGEGGMNNPNARAHKPDGTPYGPTVSQYGNSFRMAFDGSQGGSQAPAVQAIQQAASKGGGTPMPFPTQQPQAGATGQIYIDPTLIRPRTNYNEGNLNRVIASGYLGQGMKDDAFNAAMQQGQPIAIPYMDGAVLVDPRNPTHQQFMPTVHWGESQIGDIHRPIAQIPDGRGGYIQAPVIHPGATGPQSQAQPTAAPGGQPVATPVTAQNAPAAPAAPTNPVQAAAFAAPSAGGGATLGVGPGATPSKPIMPVANPQAPTSPFERFAQSTQQTAPPGIDPQDWAAYTGKKAFDIKQDINKGAQEKAAEFGAKKYDVQSAQAQAARKQMPNLDMALAMMNNPNFHSGLLLGAQDTWARFKAAALGDAGANAPNEAFDKIMAATVLGGIKDVGGGQIRNAEIQLLGKANANRNNTDASNRAVLEVSRRALQITDNLDQIGQEYASGSEVHDPITGKTLLPENVGPDGEVTPRHGLDVGYDKLARKYMKDHPSFTPEKIKHYETIFETGKDPSEVQQPNEAGKEGQAPAVGTEKQFKQGIGVWDGSNWVPKK